MGTTDQTMDAYEHAPKRGAGGFFVLILLALCVLAFALYKGDAPIKTPYPENWILWARGENLWAGVAISAVVMGFTGFIGAILRLLAPQPRPAHLSRPQPAKSPVSAYPAPAMAGDDALSIPAAMTRPAEPRPQGLPAAARDEEPAPQLFAEPPAVEVRSLEPAIFHDNASDSFMSREPEAPAAQATAQVIPIRPDVVVPVQEPARDPVEAALLADTAPPPAAAPQSDMNAVISSAMHFAEPITEAAAPVAQVLAEPTVVATAPVIVTETEPVQAVPEPVTPVSAASDDQSEIRQAVSMALSVWPDATRAIAADELAVRVGHLYYDRSAESANAFHLIATGDLKAAATAIQTHADSLAAAGRSSEAAEKWRVLGALNMGRDDAKAMAAYEKVSELDPSDSNIHLYLARRYQMAGDTAKMLPVLGRALGVISDPQTRAELLTPYADLKMKAGDARAAADAFEELGRLHETSAYLKPDDVAARSAYAITLARQAQAREMQGAFDVAGPLYRKAHQVFAELSARKPEHPGLRAMAENAYKDAQRFTQA